MSVLFWGRSTCDFSYLLNLFPKENSKSFASEYILQPGGPALNAAITFAKLAGESFIISKIGNSKFGDIVKSILNENNITLFDFAEDNNFMIPLSTVLINSEKVTRTIINSPNKEEQHQINIKSIVEIINKVKPEILFIDGYNLGNCYDALNYAKENNITIIFDGGSWKEDTDKYLKFVDIAICSNRFSYQRQSIERTIKYLHNEGIKKVAFTNDEKPIIYSIEGEINFIEIEKVDAVDTLGAGDVFHGAFCHYYLISRDFIPSLKNASIDASDSCRYFGTHKWLENK